MRRNQKDDGFAALRLYFPVELKSQCQNITSWLKTITSVQMFTNKTYNYVELRHFNYVCYNSKIQFSDEV